MVSGDASQLPFCLPTSQVWYLTSFFVSTECLASLSKFASMEFQIRFCTTYQPLGLKQISYTNQDLSLKIHIVSTVQIFFQHLAYAGFACTKLSTLCIPMTKQTTHGQEFQSTNGHFRWVKRTEKMEMAEVWKPKYGNRGLETEVRNWEEKPLLVPYYLHLDDCYEKIGRI